MQHMFPVPKPSPTPPKAMTKTATTCQRSPSPTSPGSLHATVVVHVLRRAKKENIMQSHAKCLVAVCCSPQKCPVFTRPTPWVVRPDVFSPRDHFHAEGLPAGLLARAGDKGHGTPETAPHGAISSGAWEGARHDSRRRRFAAKKPWFCVVRFFQWSRWILEETNLFISSDYQVVCIVQFCSAAVE